MGVAGRLSLRDSPLASIQSSELRAQHRHAAGMEYARLSASYCPAHRGQQTRRRVARVGVSEVGSEMLAVT